MSVTPDWYTAMLDALEAETPGGPLPAYRSSLPAPSNSIKDYFLRPSYPYPERLDPAEYYREKYELQVELVKLQNWIIESDSKLLILFEGRDTAGKGSTIRAFNEHLNPRYLRVVALNKPDRRESSQWYFQRYVKHLPSAGEIVLFDRSWYNRAGVERVMGFCSDKEYWDFVRHVPIFEEMLADGGIQMMKFYLSISKQEQSERIQERCHNPLKQWKLSPIDQEAQERWDEYTSAKEETFRLTDTPRNPWIIIKADDRFRARLQVMRCVLSLFNYPGKNPDAACKPDEKLVANVAQIYAGV